MTVNRSIAARAKALAAATEVVRELGVPEFTVDEVVRRSGVAKTTIYRHWSNGSALMLEAVDCAIEQVPTPNTGSLRTDLERFLGRMLVSAGDSNTSRMICGLLYAAADDPELRLAMNAMVAEQHTPLRTILQLAQGRGELPHDLDLELASDLIEGPMLWRHLLRREPVDPQRLSALLDLIVAGLRGATAPPS
jgi:AcrR family transcriptional regulator